MQDRVVSLETEYAISFIPATEAGRQPSREELVAALREPLNKAAGVAGSQFLRDGSKFHLDQGHAEWSLPECRGAYQAALYDRAADQALADALDAAQQHLAVRGARGRLLVAKNNVDAQGNTYGSHENYMTERTHALLADEEYLRLTVRFLVPFLVTRQIFCGTGRIVPGAERPFQISQRAEFIEAVTSSETTSRRALVNLGREQEPLADKQFRRLHLLLGDANLSGRAGFLKLGTTALLLRMLEELYVHRIPHLVDPLGALRQVAADPARRVPLALRGQQPHSAVQIQRVYLDQANEFLSEHGANAEERLLLTEWDRVLTMLDDGPHALIRDVEWVAKRHLLDGYLARKNATVEQAGADKDMRSDLQRLDIQFHDLSPAGGLYRRMLGDRPDSLFSAADFARVRWCPPPFTRAALRSDLLAAAAAGMEGIEVDGWEKWRVRGQSVTVGDPLEYLGDGMPGGLGAERAAQRLLAGLDSQSVDVVCRALRGVGHFRRPECFDLVAKCLADGAATPVRVAAVECLGVWGGTRAQDLLARYLGDGDLLVRRRARDVHSALAEGRSLDTPQRTAQQTEDLGDELVTILE